MSEKTETPKQKPVVPPNMRVETVDSLGIGDLLEIAVYNSIADIDADGGPNTALTLANMYMRQKGGLVEGRDVVVKELIKRSGFGWDPTKEKEKTVDGKTVKYNSETEGQWMARFKPAVLAGKAKLDGTSYKDEASLDAAITAISRAVGPFIVSAKKSVKEAKAKTPPDYALNGAESIIKNGSQAKWKDILSKPDAKLGIPAIVFNDFTKPYPAGADAAAKAAVDTENKLNLAWAIKAREDAKRAAQAKKEYV